MDSGRFKEPSFMAASLACLFSGLALLFRPASPPDPDPRAIELRQLRTEVGKLQALVTRLGDETKQKVEQQASFDEGLSKQIRNLQSLLTRLGDEMKPIQAVASADSQAKMLQKSEFEEALSKAAEKLSRQEFIQAHDYLLVASRISATDIRLFNAVVEFVGKAKNSQDDEVVALAEDLLDRGDSLVHFQSPKDVESSRNRLVALRSAFPAPPKAPEPEPRSEAIRRLIGLASNKEYPVVLRTKAIERVKNALDEAWIDWSPSSNEPGNDLTPEKIKAFRKQAEDAEPGCLVELFESHRDDGTKWLDETGKLINEKKNASQQPSILVGEIDKTISRGINLLQEVVPFAKFGTKGAQELYSQIEQRVGSLQRWRTWLYNQEALDTIRKADSNQRSAELNLRSMAKLDESLLAPYVSERYAEVWKKIFDSLDEDSKVEMTKARVLRTIQ